MSPKSSPSEIKIITLELISDDWAFSSLSFDKSSRAGPKSVPVLGTNLYSKFQ